jgi:hypothetical protein
MLREHSFVEYRTMDKVQKPSNSESYRNRMCACEIC